MTCYVYKDQAIVCDVGQAPLYQILQWPRRLLIDHGVIAATPDELTVATQADFDKFRLCSKYHLPQA